MFLAVLHGCIALVCLLYFSVGPLRSVAAVLCCHSALVDPSVSVAAFPVVWCAWQATSSLLFKFCSFNFSFIVCLVVRVCARCLLRPWNFQKSLNLCMVEKRKWKTRILHPIDVPA